MGQDWPVLALWNMVVKQCPCNSGSRFPWGIWVLVAAGLYAVTWWAESIKKKEGVSRMKSKLAKLAVVAALVALVAVVLAMKKTRSAESVAAVPAEQVIATQPSAAKAALPRLLDLGSTSCIPCRMMMPILDQLKTEYAGKLEVGFIDVWKDKAAGQKYGINLIPTQIFFDGSGKELFRHEGFFAKDEILAKWKELGFELTPAATSQPTAQAGVN